MSNASVQAARDRQPYEIPRATRTFPTAQGGCAICGHMTLDYPGGAWCPCEDCHIGGRFFRVEVLRNEPVRKRSLKRLTA